MYTIIAILLGYLLGSIPSSLIIGKVLYNKDIRKEGSGNLGATNAGRVLGMKPGVVVLILDQLKAMLAVLIMYFIVRNLGFSPVHLYITAAAALIGHCYPIFASFKGGKAVDCFYGFLFISNVYLYLIAFLVFIIVLKFSKIISLSSLTSVVVISLVSFIPFFHHSPILNYDFNYWYPVTLVLMALFILYRHTPNIKKLINKNESTIDWLK